MRSLAAVCGLLVLALFLAEVRADEWETGAGGGPRRNGRSAEVGPTAPVRLWQGSLPGIVAQQAVIGEGLAIMPRIASFTIPTGTTIVAHDLETGAIAWQVQLPFNDPNEWRSRVLAIRDGRVYASRTGGEVNPAKLYALDPADGSVLWASADLIEERTTESPAFAANGDLIVGNFTSVVRIDHTDGSTVWSVPRSTPTSNGASVAVFGNRGYIFEPTPAGPEITAIDLDNGTALYSSGAVAGGLVQQLGMFCGPDGTVYVPRTQNNPATDFLIAYTDTGAGFVEKWRIPIGYIPFGTHAIGPDGSVYAYRTVRNGSLADLTIVRLDPSDGSVLDTSAVIPSDFPVQPRIAVDAVGRLFFTNGGFTNGGVFCLEPDLTLRWSEPITNVNVGGPAIGPDGTLVVCGVGTDVRAYRTTDALVLNAPEPAIAGEGTTIRMRGGTPDARTFLGYGRVSGSRTVGSCPGVILGIQDIKLGATLVAGSDGKASLSSGIPPTLSGVTLYLQALEKSTCRASERVLITLE